jgi:hypothetical protein
LIAAYWKDDSLRLTGFQTGSKSLQQICRRYRSHFIVPCQSATCGTRTSKEIFDLPALDEIFGHAGTANDSTYKFTIGRDDLTILAMGTHINKSIGLNTWAAFAGTSDTAHVAGDFAMLESKVNPVIKTLQAQNIEVVAVHNHMIGEQPA